MTEDQKLLVKVFIALSDFMENGTPYPQGEARNQLLRGVLGEFSGCVLFAEDINAALEPITNELYEALKAAGIDPMQGEEKG